MDLRRLAALATRPRLPRRTVRLRLTLFYAALFLVSGAALLATSLSVKPLLHVLDGHIVPLEKVRTSSKAIARLVR